MVGMEVKMDEKMRRNTPEMSRTLLVSSFFQDTGKDKALRVPPGSDLP